ncbi:MAG: stage II sporulation protein R [Clostridia bacterium]|nr:stage II sporulation protein R [Clostridia bacterium]
MKKICISFLIVAIIILSGIGLFAPKPQAHTEYLRIHIRANSNEFIDQNVKYKVKSAVVEFLTPYIANCKDKKSAEDMLSSNLTAIKQVCNDVLKQNGFNYTANAKIKNEEFPTRVYEGVQLESGFYDALIIELGCGEGDNWWCVVYPPLCFVGKDSGYVYRSKILDVINDFLNKEKL